MTVLTSRMLTGNLVTVHILRSPNICEVNVGSRKGNACFFFVRVFMQF